MIDIKSRLILSKSKLADIGSVAVESTYSEEMIESLIWSLAGMPPHKGKFFTSGMLMQRKLEMLSDLGKQRLAGKRKLAEFTKIIAGLKLANTERNIIIHGVWHHGISLREMMRANWPQYMKPKSVKRRLRSNPQEFSARKIRGTAHRISRFTEALRRFALKTWPHLP